MASLPALATQVHHLILLDSLLDPVVVHTHPVLLPLYVRGCELLLIHPSPD